MAPLAVRCSSLLCFVFSHSVVSLCDPIDCSPLGSSVHGISRQGYWSGLPSPSPGDLLDSGLKFMSPVSSALAGRVFTTTPPGSPSSLLALLKDLV